MTSKRTHPIGLLLVAAPIVYVGVRVLSAAHQRAAETRSTTNTPDASASSPAAATASAAHPPLGARLTTSTIDATGRVTPSPAELLAQARQVDGAITLDELAAARLIASERGDVGSTVEWCAIVDAECNRAAHANKSLFDSLTRGADFGVQGRARPASTRQDGAHGHLLAAREVLSGAARGIARGAVRFFDPLEANRGAARNHATCDALTLLDRWSFGLPFVQSGPCALDYARVGADNPPQAWIGPVNGIDAWRLMLFAPLPATDVGHLARYQAARALLLAKEGAS